LFQFSIFEFEGIVLANMFYIYLVCIIWIFFIIGKYKYFNV